MTVCLQQQKLVVLAVVVVLVVGIRMFVPDVSSSTPTSTMGSSSRLPELHLNLTAPIGTVDQRFVSFTLDWWPADQGCASCAGGGWGPHANVLAVDLRSPKLLRLASALCGPACILRIGGSLDKVVAYEFPSERMYRNESSNRPCLNASRWDALHEFADAIHAQIVFGLSYPQTGIEGQWNATPAAALLRYSRQQNYSRQTTLYGVELAEELSGSFAVGSGAFRRYIRAYHVCAKLLQSFYQDNRKRPLLMGPCPGMNWPALLQWFSAFLKETRGALDVAVYHSYNQIAGDKLYLNFTNPYRYGNMTSAALQADALKTARGKATSGDTGWQAVAMKKFVDRVNTNDNIHHHHNTSLWLGEMGPHNGGGGPGNISSTFASFFGYLDTLGSLARMEHQVVARQTLVGGKYELLQCTTTSPMCEFGPHPDYWVALLWRRLMGNTVLEAPRVSDVCDAPWKDALRFHAHCSANTNNGSLTLAFSNKSPNRTFTLKLPVELGAIREEYVLQGHQYGLNADKVEFNGSVLHVGNSSRLPPLTRRTVPNSNDKNRRFAIPPTTLGFVVFADAKVMACIQEGTGSSITNWQR